jgi:NAD(P)-dependent dehydrogenase (short-subunit alcohol dehydrogenase family)
VNNAGGDASIRGGWAEWLDVTEDGWDRMLRLNLKGQVFGAQAANAIAPPSWRRRSPRPG